MTTDSTSRSAAGRGTPRRLIRVLRPSLYVLLLLSCHDEHTGPERVASLEVTPRSLALMVGENVELRADARSEGGNSLSGRVVTWASRDPDVASVSSTGAVTAVAIGETQVFVASEGAWAVVSVTVTAPIGEVAVEVLTVGHFLDPDGYRLLIDGQSAGAPLSASDNRLIALPPGMHTATLDDVANGCELAGERSRTLFVVARQRLTVVFNVNCLLNGRLVVKAQTTGQRRTADPYRVTLDGGSGFPLDPNGQVQVDLRPRKYDVALSTGDDHCIVDYATQQSLVTESSTSNVLFRVSCYPDVPTMSGEKLVVAAHISGSQSVLDVMDTDGTHRRRLTQADLQEWAPALSPDGRRLAFSRQSQTSNAVNLVVLDLATGKEWVSVGSGFGSRPSWAPDGQRLVALVQNVLVIVRTDGSVERSLPITDVSDPQWSPDGGTIAFIRGRDILLVNSNGANQRQLTASPDRYFEGGFWSPDGRSLLVRSYVLGNCYYYNYYCYPTDSRVSVLDAATGREIRNVPIPDDASGFVWGATNAEVYFVQGSDVFRSRLDPFAPGNVTRSPDLETSVLWGRFTIDAAAIRAGSSLGLPALRVPR